MEHDIHIYVYKKKRNIYIHSVCLESEMENSMFTAPAYVHAIELPSCIVLAYAPLLDFCISAH